MYYDTHHDDEKEDESIVYGLNDIRSDRPYGHHHCVRRSVFGPRSVVVLYIFQAV